MKEQTMKKLACNVSGDGYSTKHRIKFRSRRSTIEGGHGSGSDESVSEYEGVLFENTHFESHLCVRVDHQEHWGRKDDWHGHVCRDSVIAVTLVDEFGEAVDGDDLERVAEESFLSAWGSLINKLTTC
jgi:hypothetical protein